MPRATLHVLVDNQAMNPALGFEHGWSVLVGLEDGPRWLWDTGQTELFLANARALGLDLRDIAGLAVSHGHHDHAGGLPGLLAAGFTGPVVGHPAMLSRRYCRRDGSTYRSIGMGDGRLPLPPPGFSPEEDLRELAPGLVFLTGIARQPGAFAATDNFFLDTAGLVPDTVPDDACLVIAGEDGPAVLLGCCHSGLGNTLAQVRRRLGLTAVDTVIGGLHLGRAPESALAETRDALTAFGVRQLQAGHCTGAAALDWLDQNWRGQVLPTGSGLTLVL